MVCPLWEKVMEVSPKKTITTMESSNAVCGYISKGIEIRIS